MSTGEADLSADVTAALTDESAASRLEEIYLARQPILDRDGRLVAYELLFRGGNVDYARVDTDLHASSTVVHNTVAGLGIESVLGKVQGFVNVDREFLLSDLVDLLAPEQIVLEILESVIPEDDVIARMIELRARGFRLALDDFVAFGPGAEELLAQVDIVKIDLLRVAPEALPDMVACLRVGHASLLAEKVETREQFLEAKRLGFDLFQGYHFARPQLLTGRQQRDPEKIKLLRLLTLIMSDADFNTLESEFKRHPLLTFNLLRMVNSAAMGLRTRIDSLRHAMVLLGRRSLQSWMQLTLYASDSATGAANPLLQMAAVRGKLMELLMRADPKARQNDFDAAFFTGILSLLDALLEMPREAIIAQLFVVEEVREALLRREGRLGGLLRLAELAESGDAAEVAQALGAVPDVSPETFRSLQLEAFAWGNAVEAELTT